MTEYLRKHIEVSMYSVFNFVWHMLKSNINKTIKLNENRFSFKSTILFQTHETFISAPCRVCNLFYFSLGT